MPEVDPIFAATSEQPSELEATTFSSGIIDSNSLAFDEPEVAVCYAAPPVDVCYEEAPVEEEAPVSDEASAAPS